MNDLKRYTREDLSGAAKTILTISIIAAVFSIITSFEHMTSIGTTYGLIELIGAIGNIVACSLMLSVNILGFYIYLSLFAIASFILFCINLEVGITYLISAIFAVGFVFLLLQIRKNGISSWKMMLANQKLKKEDHLPEMQIVANNEAEEVYELPELPCKPSPLPSVSDVVDEESSNPSIIVMPPHVEVVTETLKSNQEDGSSMRKTVSEETLISGEPPVKEFNIFVKLAIGIFILLQILSILLDISILRNISGEEYIQLFRLGISVVNILLIIYFIEYKHVSTLSISIVLSIIQMFLIDFDALSLNTDVRDASFNLIYFLCMFSPLLLTLFFEKDGITGWNLITGKHTNSTQKADETEPKINDLAIIEKGPSVDIQPSSVKKEEANVIPSPVLKSTVESAPKPIVPPVPEPVVECSTPVVNPQLDRYTRLCHAISPANFVSPYSPKKVKLANELLEALIKNKDNDVVISLIEEKAKTELGVEL